MFSGTAQQCLITTTLFSVMMSLIVNGGEIAIWIYDSSAVGCCVNTVNHCL